jgi:hypothetical protein
MTERVLGDGFYVDTDELRRVARVVGGLAHQLKGGRSRFSSGGQVSGDAFGVLPQAAQALSQYRKAHRDSLTNLETFLGVIEEMSSDLNTSADNYDFADQGRL